MTKYFFFPQCVKRESIPSDWAAVAPDNGFVIRQQYSSFTSAVKLNIDKVEINGYHFPQAIATGPLLAIKLALLWDGITFHKIH